MTMIDVVSTQCLPYPVAAKIGNVTLSNAQEARGVAVSIGTPEQEFAFLPQWHLNNTLVYGTNGFCIGLEVSPQTEDGCTTFRGGQYDMVASSSRKKTDSDSHPVDGAQFPSMNFVSDNVKINENVSLDGFPIGIPLQDWAQQGYHPMMALGMGANSTLLTALTSSGKIASRVWSMFHGWTGGSSRSQVDGTFVLGGYDRAKVNGRGYKMSLQQTEGCDTAMMVTITDLVLNFPNGTTASIFPNTLRNALTACIVPDYPVLMTLPIDPHLDNFMDITNQTITQRTFGEAYFSMVYSDDDVPYDGDMTIVIQAGPSIRIPNHQLIVPNRVMPSDSPGWVANYSSHNLVINGIQGGNSDDVIKLGRQFLSSAYVMLNQDTSEFTLWESNPTADVDLVAVDSSGNESTEWCEPEEIESPSGSGTPAQTNPASAESDSGPSTGLIAGAAAGGGAALIIIAIVSWLLIRRRHKKRAAAAAAALAPEIQYTGAPADHISSHDGWSQGGTPANGQVPQYAELPYQEYPRDGYFKPELQGTTPDPHRPIQGPKDQNHGSYELA
ncbi:conserved hypothetical protein [Verticillium alfalfae VaMs.102]|uniref:Peptidase A1 domain-containing protein n=1 Tax=Verticillium alfalfae (strain VaMs.102 / ATCC MYA-4576 / FGSC 10136) TaxID=526221 RepID=C9SMY3_VERA1|nr:conserved hypothetical protein [Verticillium alfalfae VaMs.102]EEY20148.1 conserved hypothetical protein [Verticillium alfalfae VaMs.102]